MPPNVSDDEDTSVLKFSPAVTDVLFKRKRVLSTISSPYSLRKRQHLSRLQDHGSVRHANLEGDDETDTSESEVGDETSQRHASPDPKLRERPFVRVPAPGLPASAFHGGPTRIISSESDACYDLHIIYPPLQSNDDPNEFVALELNDFEIYRPATDGKRFALTLASLNELLTYPGDNCYCFDGWLSYGNVRHYVEDVQFKTLSIAGYGSDDFNLDNIFIQSELNKGTQIWYQLGKPSRHYQVYHHPFEWLATFTKHFEEYLGQCRSACLRDFEHDFFISLRKKHGQSPELEAWHAQFNHGKDFRQVVAAHYEYLWKETSSVADDPGRHAIWNEVDARYLNAVPEQDVKIIQTMVTPFVERCFRQMYFAPRLEAVPVSPAVEKALQLRADELGLSVTPHTSSRQDQKQWHAVDRREMITTGSVVVLDRDADGVWQDDSHEWFAFIQGIHHDRSGPYLSLLWMYRPSETIIDKAYYPFDNELFFSDHCNCEDSRVRLTCVKGILPIQLFAKPIPSNGDRFIRQTYITPDEDSGKDAAFVTLKQEHLRCRHRTTVQQSASIIANDFPVGCTVLYEHGSKKKLLEPAVVVEHRNSDRTVVRRMKRRKAWDCNARPNELVDTHELVIVQTSDIVRQCHVRRYTEADVRRGRIPAPYSYNGTGDCWVLTGTLVAEARWQRVDAVELTEAARFTEGFDPNSVCGKRLDGLSLFSGGGSFDRGLEEGGAVRTRWAVEIDKGPMHTYKANLRDAETQLWLGSVNDFLAKACADSRSLKIAKIGQVLFLCAGSPCKAFSLATHDKNSDKALGYASLVASVLAYINIYLPLYGVLENVYDMCKGLGKTKTENVYCQVVACLVGLGYQTKTSLCDAPSYGSPQSRSRLFINIAAPGLQPAKPPVQTHACSTNFRGRSIGKTLSGIRFGMREKRACPFNQVTAADAIIDLPNINRGLVRTNVPFPDHRMISRETYEKALVPEMIPRFPLESSWVSTVKAGLMPQALVDLFEGTRHKEWHADGSKAYKRLAPHSLLPTIRTTITLDDSRMGNGLHFDQPRVLTIMEARRAQSIPDSEVLIGTPHQQWLVVGNGVDRKASVAMGLSIREAWFSEETQSIVSQQGYSASIGALPCNGQRSERGTSESPVANPPSAGGSHAVLPGPPSLAHDRYPRSDRSDHSHSPSVGIDDERHGYNSRSPQSMTSRVAHSFLHGTNKDGSSMSSVSEQSFIRDSLGRFTLARKGTSTKIEYGRGSQEDPILLDEGSPDQASTSNHGSDSSSIFNLEHIDEFSRQSITDGEDDSEYEMEEPLKTVVEAQAATARASWQSPEPHDVEWHKAAQNQVTKLAILGAAQKIADNADELV